MCNQQRLRVACAYAQSDQSLCWLLEYSMNINLLTEHHLEFLRLKGGCTGPSESIHVKMPHCWKSRVTAQISYDFNWCVNCSTEKCKEEGKDQESIESSTTPDPGHLMGK